MKRHILVIDGIGKTKLEISIALKKYNIEIIGAKDIIGAVGKINELKDCIRLLIVDADDEEFEIENIVSIKNIKACKDIPLIVVSHHKEKKYILKAITAGASEYIVKPFSEELILNKINDLIGLSYNPKEKVLEEDYDIDDTLRFSLKDILSIHFKSMSRGNYPLSVIMMRLINTKESKEIKRAEILEVILKATKLKLRETDIIIRYGIDNILILLPFTDGYGANLVEKKIREHYLESRVINQKAEGFILATSIVTTPEEGRDKNYILMKLKTRLNPTMFFTKKNITN